MTAPSPIDARARQARERFELAIARNDAQGALEHGREMLAVCDADHDYQLLAIVPVARVEPARLIVTTRDQACARCCKALKAGDSAWWAPGTAEVNCTRCGGGK